MAERPPLYRRRWPYMVLAGLLVVAAAAGSVMGYYLRLDLPDVRSLEDYQPPVMTRILSYDGATVATFAEEKRLLLDYGQIPPAFREALIASEDSTFMEHTGVDVKGIFRALLSDLRTRRMAQGASTLTMQLAGMLFLDRSKKTVRRKIQEAVLAMEIERQYSKEEILRFYSNQVHIGHGLYGLEAAARHYFGKPAQELTLSESAILVGILPRPADYTPFRNLDIALRRRFLVLERMVTEGYITPETARLAAEEPVVLNTEGSRREELAPFFVEEVRRWLQTEYGNSGLYKEGLETRTTLDRRLQAVANLAVEEGLRELDKRLGWRGEKGRLPEDADAATWESEDWQYGIEAGRVLDGLVEAVEAGSATVRVGPYRGQLDAAAVAWTKQKRLDKLVAAGDVIRVRIEELDEEGAMKLILEQEPAVEAALVALEPTTGAIRALVGGFDFERSEFNRAIQAKRQTGSAFKPFVLAAALDNGWTLGDTVVDAPTVFMNPQNRQPYQPENYTNKYYETVTLRAVMEKSANIATVKLLQDVGYNPIIETARALGIRGGLQPFPSLALGSFEISLVELTSAYGTFANRGVHVEPHLVAEVLNRAGAPVGTMEPAVRDAVSPQTAYLMNSVLSGVISDGTGRAASSLAFDVAGKTGTTDDYIDAWFVGYSADLAVGVWVGFDEPRSLGTRETGARAALPIWKKFMERAYEESTGHAEFDRPERTVTVVIDRHTGLRANERAQCQDVISEVFVEGTEPTAYCSEYHHQRNGFPYAFQKYPLTDQGALQIPAAELNRVLDHEFDVYLVDGRSRLEAHTAEGTYSLAIEVMPGGEPAALPDWVGQKFDASEWVGLDGKPAEILWLR